MTIENSLERIATALEALANVEQSASQAAPTVTDPVVPAAPAAPVTPPPATTAAPAAPAAPAQPAATPSPFNTPDEMLKYVMDSYTALGPDKGAGIQAILTNLGYSNINDVQPAHYGDLHAAIEQLKVS